MRRDAIACWAIVAMLLIGISSASFAAASDAADALPLIPYAKSVELHDGMLALEPGARIVATDPSLTPLAKILSREIYLARGLRLAVSGGPGQAGDIVLRLDSSLRAGKPILTVRDQAVTTTHDGAYTLTVGSQVVVTGFDYRAAAEGTSTLLQLLNAGNGALTLPKLAIKDWPQSDFDAVMVDVARQEIPIAALKQAVEACRLYRVRYMQLHLNDDQAWVFPSKAYPKLGTRNGSAHGGIIPRVYSLQALKDLVAFAGARGVTLVPEMETAAHTGAMRRAMPALFDSPNERGRAHLGVMNMANDKIYPALDTLVAEMREVFKSSPYFHIGCDEASFGTLRKQPEVQAYMKAHGLKNIHELFLQHVKRMNRIVRKHGLMTIVWEGAAIDRSMSKTVLVETWVNNSNYASRLQKQGFTTITVPWNLHGIPWYQWTMYDCNASRLSRDDRVLGAMLPMWEMSAPALVNAYLPGIHNGPSYLPGIPQRQIGTWSPDHVVKPERFLRHQARHAALLKRIVRPVNMTVNGMLHQGAPSQYTASGNANNIFYQVLTVTLAAPVNMSGTIHYTTDGSVPTVKSPTYTKPLSLTDSTTVKAALFSTTGDRLGYVSQHAWRHVRYQHNLTTGKPVTTDGGTQGKDHQPELAVDGRLDTSWWAGPYPKWLQVDLQKVYDIDRIQLFPYWGGSRYYQYAISVSTDGQHWRQVVDESRNEQPSSPKGRMFDIKNAKARYVRVNMLKNSANEGVHIKELRVFAVGKTDSSVLK